MIKFIALIALVWVQLNVIAQPAIKSGLPVKGERSIVKSWDSRSIYIVSDAFFDETKADIIAQIGTAEFDEVQAHCALKGWPEGLYLPDLSDEDDKAFEKKLNQLKMYKIAAYLHKFNGKVFDRYVILRVPYNENKSWNEEVTWEGNIYFLLHEEDVVPFK